MKDHWKPQLYRNTQRTHSALGRKSRFFNRRKRGSLNIKIVDSPLELKLSGVVKTHDPAKSYGDELLELLNVVWESVMNRSLPTTGINHAVYGDQGEIFAGVVITIPGVPPEGLSAREIVLKRYAYYKHVGSYAGLPQANEEMVEEIERLGLVRKAPLIEKLTGRLYRDFIREHVLQVANMHRSDFYAFNDLPENTANGYLKDRRTTNIYQLPLRGGGDGGMYTTTDDLRAFWDSWFSHRILSAELTATYLKTHCTLNATGGYGCVIYKRLDDSMFSIVGGDAGVGFDSRYFVSERLTINILSNITNGEEAMREVVLSHF